MTIICINPNCITSNQSVESVGRYCPNCDSDLILQNRYRVTSTLRIDRGFSNIYEVEDRGNTKILKVLRRIYSKNIRVVYLFRQEVNILNHFDHPGLPQCDGYFQYKPNKGEELHCIVMEKINGYNLEEWVHKNKQISEKQALEWLEKIALILKLVQDKKYLHRDIKPHNIMLNANGQLVLIDFGAATRINFLYKAYNIIILFCANFLFNRKEITDGYTAPEQNKNCCVPQSDFFALGRTFVFLLTGKEPKDEAIYNAEIDQVNWRKYANGISDELADLIDKMMSYEKKERHKDVDEILKDLDKIYRHYYSRNL